jgi:metal-dependent amidase/aminoacylase/carboxypeptidase family protein
MAGGLRSALRLPVSLDAHVCTANMGCAVSISRHAAKPLLGAMTQRLWCRAPALRRILGPTNVVEVPQRMGGEDFSYYSGVVPFFFLRLGSGNTANGITAAAHTAAFDMDEDCLVVGVKALAAIVVASLERP